MTALSPDTQRSLLVANAICLASMIVWAAGLPAANLIIPHMPPVALTAARATLAAMILFPVWWAVEGRTTIARANWISGAWVGFVSLGLASIFVIMALALTDTVTVAVVTATMPVVGIALECLADRRPFTRAIAFGLGLSLIGGALTLSGGVGAIDLGYGALAALASVVCYTWGSRETVRAFPELTPLGRSALTVTGAALVMLVTVVADGLVRGVWPDWQSIGWPEFGGLAMFGIGSMAVSQLMWIVSVGRIGIGAASLHMNAVPFYVMLIVFLTGGPWSWGQAAGAVVVVTGALIAQGILSLRN